MNIMTRSAAPSGDARWKHRAVAKAALAILFWSFAALLVALTHQWLDATSAVASVVVEVGAIIAMAAAYIRFAASDATLDHALLVGTAWVLLAIVAEIAMTASSGRQWFALLGSPAHGGLRCVLLIAWVVAPALFASSHE